ncbi:MAG: amidohydrolase family protein [Planctomycetota bacterium]|jgi:cytosine/adenosine deaminase-related metal-dependent hydrolase
MPALVNAHCHLDLTDVGPLTFDGDFVGWIDQVRRRRPAEGEAVAAAVRRGIGLCRAGGTAIVGDIAGAGSLEPCRELAAAAMAGVSFLEVIGIGRGEAPALEALAGMPAPGRPAGALRLGISPHAPYSCGPAVYRAAAGLGLPMATHLAETPQELQFVDAAEGPLADFLRNLGLWDDRIAAHHVHPVDHLAEVLAARPVLAAHLNYIEQRHLSLLAAWNATVAYCPRSSAYFGHPPHRYRTMLDAGVNVALGTDGFMCLDTPDRISVLDEMRLLYRRDGTDPVTLLRMATVGGAKGLGFDPGPVTLEPGPTIGLIAAPFDPGSTWDPLRQVLTRDDPPRWIAGPFDHEIHQL